MRRRPPARRLVVVALAGLALMNLARAALPSGPPPRDVPTPDVPLPSAPVPGVAPFRGPLPRPDVLVAGAAHRPDVLQVKLHASAGLRWDGTRLRDRSGRVWSTPGGHVLRPLVPDAGAGEVGLWYRIESDRASELAARLLRDPVVETVNYALRPAPPPSARSLAVHPPSANASTPDFREAQGWLDPEGGVGATEASRWPGARGEGISVADIEYGWTEDHEDLAATVGAHAWGSQEGRYLFHGTSVLGQLFGTENGWGVVGGIPEATARVASPFDETEDYNLAAAIVGIGAQLLPGDVLLIEQQAYCPDGGGYCPVEVDDAVFDAIAAVVAAGIVVVEPAANGGRNLDDRVFEGRFDRSLRDSGAILVGGGASPESGMDPRIWYPYGSSYGARVDVQGWFDHIVTTTNGDYGGMYADLYFPDEDPLRAYTATFAGTSGASPMVAVVAAAAQAALLAERGEPMDPVDLRALLVSTGTPEPVTDGHHIGPLPDLRRLLRTLLR